MPLIDQTVLEEIRLRCPIEDVVSTYVTLKRSGSGYVGLCPFHSEKTPSFTVSPDKGFFHCFGCGVGGDVITFVRRVENLDYPSAVELLAKRVGITVKRSESERIDSDRRERTLAMNKEAARYFNNILLTAPEGKKGLDYLLSRGLTMPLIRHFGLGFAPDDFGAFPQYMHRLGFSDAELSAAYLARISDKTGHAYSLFRNRVIFPIISPSGDVIAFGGRVMDDSKPKYLNSSDTPAFKKSKNLFALNFAKASCSSQMILCEGYMDVIALHGAGFTNAVATLGTAITPEQARIFERYTKSVVICYDADEAGQNAASKAFRLLGEVGVECRILKVKNAKDPDEYIRKYGAAAFRKLMEGSRSEFDFRFDAIREKYDLSLADDKIKALDETVALIAGVSSAARRDLHIYATSEIFGVSPDSMRRDVERLRTKRMRTEKRDETQKIMFESAGYNDRVNPDAVKNIRASRAENAVLGILMIHPEYIGEMKNRNVEFSPDKFVTSFGKKTVALMLDHSNGSEFDELSLGEGLTVDEMGRLSKLKLDRQGLSNTFDIMLSCMATLADAAEKKELDINDMILKKRNKSKNTNTNTSTNININEKSEPNG